MRSIDGLHQPHCVRMGKRLLVPLLTALSRPASLAVPTARPARVRFGIHTAHRPAQQTRRMMRTVTASLAES
eukprot:5416973-Prymnesium_polylepis.1